MGHKQAMVTGGPSMTAIHKQWVAVDERLRNHDVKHVKRTCSLLKIGTWVKSVRFRLSFVCGVTK